MVLGVLVFVAFGLTDRLWEFGGEGLGLGA